MPRHVYVFMLFCAGCADQAAEPWPEAARRPEEPLVKLDGKVHVRLHFSVTKLDPKDPKDAYMECIVENGTDQALRVPTVYDCWHDPPLILVAQLYHPLRLVSWNRESTQEYIRLESGKQHRVFKFSLKEVLLDPIENQPGQRKVGWTWEA